MLKNTQSDEVSNCGIENWKYILLFQRDLKNEIFTEVIFVLVTQKSGNVFYNSQQFESQFC